MDQTQSNAEKSQELYSQRRRVEALRQQALFPQDHNKANRLIEELIDSEAILQEMQKTYAFPEFEGILIDTGRDGMKPGGVLMGDSTTDLDITVTLRQEYLPTSIVHLFEVDEHPLVTFELKYSGGENVRLRLKSYVEGYSAMAVDTLELTYKDKQAKIHQLPTFFPDKLNLVTELTRATLHIEVDDLDGKTRQHSTFPIWLLARTSAYLEIRDPSTNKKIDLRPYLGAWVTPNTPQVMELLRDAVDLHPQKQIVGFQTDPAGVRQQVSCIFEALKVRDIKYINSIVSFGGRTGEFIQRIRLPRETIEYKSANCVDGTVLMASILEFASLNPGIVLVPGHAFLAWETWETSNIPMTTDEKFQEWDYLETTMIDSADFKSANERGRKLARVYKEKWEDTGDSTYFNLISIKKVRSILGISPME